MKNILALIAFSVCLYIVPLSIPTASAIEPVPGQEFCTALGFIGREHNNCATADLWSIDIDDYTPNYRYSPPPVEKDWIYPAQSGDPEAQFNMGFLYAVGQDEERQRVGVEWYRKSASQGNVCAQHNLALMYLAGAGVERDPKEAVKLLYKASEGGYARSKRVLWKLLFFGHGGLDREYFKAVKLLREAAMQGDHSAVSLYGEVFRNRGFGTMYWKELAFDDYYANANKGDAIAQYLVAYAVGPYRRFNPPKDLGEDMKWYRKAADQGLVEALEQVVFYGSHLKSQISDAEMARWKKMLAEHKDHKWEKRYGSYIDQCLGKNVYQHD